MGAECTAGSEDHGGDQEDQEDQHLLQRPRKNRGACGGLRAENRELISGSGLHVSSGLRVFIRSWDPLFPLLPTPTFFTKIMKADPGSDPSGALRSCPRCWQPQRHLCSVMRTDRISGAFFFFFFLRRVRKEGGVGEEEEGGGCPSIFSWWKYTERNRQMRRKKLILFKN